MASEILRPFKALLEISFQPITGRTGMNAAISILLTQAIQGSYPDLSVDYSQVLVAKGSLKKAENALAVSTGTGRLSFYWTNNTGSGNANGPDRAILVACCDKGVVFTTNGATRASGEGQLNVPHFSGREVHTWISFRSESGELTGESVYSGAVQVR